MISPVSGSTRSLKTPLRGSERFVSEKFDWIGPIPESRGEHRGRRIAQDVRSGSCPRNRDRYTGIQNTWARVTTTAFTVPRVATPSMAILGTTTSTGARGFVQANDSSNEPVWTVINRRRL